MLKYAFRNDLNEKSYFDIAPARNGREFSKGDRRGGDKEPVKDFFRSDDKARSRDRRVEDGKVRLFVALGKKDGVTPKKLVDFIQSETKVRDRKIDNVQILESFSFMTVPHEEAEIILDYFRKRKQGKKSLIEKAQN
jgi:hypothetical protein